MYGNVQLCIPALGHDIQLWHLFLGGRWGLTLAESAFNSAEKIPVAVDQRNVSSGMGSSPTAALSGVSKEAVKTPNLAGTGKLNTRKISF